MSIPTDLRRNNFDLLRLLAATQVAVIHGAEHLHLPGQEDNWIIKLLWMFPGVPIFFAISGFLISWSFERNPNPKQYFWNRAIRIYPGLWTCLAVSIVAVLIFGSVSWPINEVVPWLAAQLTVGQFYNPPFLREFGLGALNGSLWTIPIEMQFYIAIPILYAVFGLLKHKRNAALVILFFIALAINQYYVTEREALDEFTAGKLFGVTLFPYIYYFLFGILIQRNFTLIYRAFVGCALYWLIGFLILQFALQALGWNVTGNYMNPISGVVLSRLTISAAYTVPKVSDLVLRRTDISYGMYIYHMVIINVMIEHELVGKWRYLWLALGCTTTIGLLSWFIVERNAMRLKKSPLRRIDIDAETKPVPITSPPHEAEAN